jgi:hypothetical protein
MIKQAGLTSAKDMVIVVYCTVYKPHLGRVFTYPYMEKTASKNISDIANEIILI